MPATILAVEDNPALLLLIKRFLQRDGHAVIAASNGVEALAAMPARPDCIITDLYMPEMDGFDLIMALRDSPRFDNVPIILLSGETDEATLGIARELGADLILGKPFSVETLREAVASALPMRTPTPGAATGPYKANTRHETDGVMDNAANW
ncbi:MAG: response regulator [Desulfovibrionaceae bacterium]